MWCLRLPALAVLAMLALLALAVAACGDDGSTTPSPAATNTPAHATAPIGHAHDACRADEGVHAHALPRRCRREARRRRHRLRRPGEAEGAPQVHLHSCTTQPQGVGAPPPCPTGTASGANVDVFPGASCEGYYVFPATIDHFLANKGGRRQRHLQAQRAAGFGRTALRHHRRCQAHLALRSRSGHRLPTARSPATAPSAARRPSRSRRRVRRTPHGWCAPAQ